MIEKMLKAYCVARARERDRFLDGLAELGVIHLKPVDPARAVADEKIVSGIDKLKRALQLIEQIEQPGEAPELDPLEAAEEILAIQRSSAEKRSRLSTLYRQLEALRIWGDVTREQFDRLKAAGIEVRFFAVPEKLVEQVKAECVERVGTLPGKRAIVAVATRGQAAELPPEVEELQIPKRDRPSIRAEAAEIDRSLKEEADKLRQLAGLKEKLQEKLSELEEKAEYSVAVKGALAAEELFAVQGWVPASKAPSLLEGLSAKGIEAAVECFDPPEDEQPPTLIRFPKWVRPIKALFDILGAVPGYREADLSPFFMIAIPLFAAIIIGDAGYGLVFLAMGAFLLKKLRPSQGKEQAHLLLIVGTVTFLWGVVTGGFFGVSPINLASQGGLLAKIGYAWNRVTVTGVPTSELIRCGQQTDQMQKLARQATSDLRIFLMQISFVIAVIHLVLAKVQEAALIFPDQRSFASLGWASVLVGIFGVIWYLFFQKQAGKELSSIWLYFLAAGWIAAVLFSAPHRNIIKRLGAGLASCLLPVMDSFSNTMSYIRLMAVSLASVYIAQVFNLLGSQLAGFATWFAAAPVVIFGHGLNICLCVIAIFAHGVRLNMLEFSSNAGVQWSGYPFKPFTKSKVKES